MAEIHSGDRHRSKMARTVFQAITFMTGVVCVCVVFNACLSTYAAQQPQTTDAERNKAKEDKLDPNAVLFVGNSHVAMHNLPDLVTSMMSYRSKEHRATYRYVPVATLDDAADNQDLKREIESGKWGTVVLQAQKISSSGKYQYSTEAGIELAKNLKKGGARVFFFSEWGLQGVDGHTDFTEKIYRSMAKDSEAECICVGRAWESVLSASPNLALFSRDGNHQSRLGASLTGLMICCRLTGERPSTFQDFQAPDTTKEQWRLFQEKVDELLSR